MNFSFLRKHSTSFILGLIIIFIFLIIGTALNEYLKIFNGGYSHIQDDWGSFGDFIGGVGGTLLSLIAVFLIFFTYLLQKKELEKTTLALNAQNEQLKIQQYQNMLFRLLERKDLLLNSIFIINTITVDSNQNENGYEFREEYIRGIPALSSMILYVKSKEQETERDEALKKFWARYHGRLTAFFNSFITTIKYLTGFEATTTQQENVKEQLIRVYASNLSLEEKEVLNTLLEYHHKFPSEYSKRDIKNCIKESWNYHIVALNDYTSSLIVPFSGK